MSSGPHLLALRVLEQDYALEPDRNYLIGSAEDCDFRLNVKNVAPHHARLRLDANGVEVTDLGSPIGICRNGFRFQGTRIEVGDVLGFGDATAALVPDDGQALMVPLPELRQQAVQRRVLAARGPASVRRPPEGTFVDLMAAELHRAPWLMASLTTHALIILALWFLYPLEPPSGRADAAVGLDIDSAPLTNGAEDAQTPEVVREREEPELPIKLDELPEPDEVAVIEAEPTKIDPLGQLKVNARLTRKPEPANTSKTHNTGSIPNIDSIGSSSFRKTVAQLKNSGLEIVFVFDSTGSMGTAIQQTKETIVEMLDVLRVLVPDARVGLVTYRDRGRDEDYVVRQLPLSQDFWHASNFVQCVTAEGGGDRPEAVREGLQAAFGQNWRRASRRVVILAGDAPPHANSWRKLLRDVRAFSRQKDSHVHTLVTSPRDAGRDTHERFGRIAKGGNGECLPLKQHEHLMKTVLDLAFGREFDGDLAAVRKAVTNERTRTQTWALDLSRRGGAELASALRADPVDAALLNALVRLPKRRVMLQLIDAMTDKKTPVHTRHAIAWVLQQVLELSQPPVDPMSGEPIRGRELRQLRFSADRLPH